MELLLSSIAIGLLQFWGCCHECLTVLHLEMRYMHCSHTQCRLQVVSELVESARNNDYTDVVMIHEHRGEPDGIVVCHLPYGPSAYFGIFNTVS